MDTARLRVLLVAPESELPGASSEMRADLREALHRAERDARVWFAWRHRGGLIAVSARLDEDPSQAQGRPVLVSFAHDAASRVIGSSSWLETKPAVWTSTPAP